MASYLIQFLLWLPPEMVVFLIAMVPVIELRGALPIALTVYKLGPAWSYLLSVLGNLFPVLLILLYIGPVSDWLRKKSRLMDGFFVWLFERTRHRVAKKYEQYGLIALALFVAIPLPMTGAWTGSLAAWLFGVDNRKAFLAIFFGVLFAGVVVLLATTGAVKFLNFII